MPTQPETSEIRGYAREIKFMVSPECAETIRQWARQRMEPDPHAGGPTGDTYRISSLYFDTLQFDVFHRNRSYGRAKYRIRRYDDSKKVFLERKLKSVNVVGKRRSIMKVKHLRRLGNTEPDRDWPGFWFHRRLLLRGLNPVCQVSYARTALEVKDPLGTVRLTLDQDLAAFPSNGFEFDDSERSVPMTGGQVIVEMKYRREMPPLFEEIVREFGLVQRPMSKYRIGARALGLVGDGVAEREERCVLRLPLALGGYEVCI